jgi:hypothetical protein
MAIPPGSTLYYVVLFLICGNVLAVFIGVLMLVAPRRLGDLFRTGNRWISTRRLIKPLDTPHPTDRAMLRYPRALGAVLLASAALILVKGAIFISEVSVADGGRMLARLYPGSRLPDGAWESLWLSLIGLIMLGAVLAVVVGLMALFRLRWLTRWAESVNRWVSTRQATRPLETPRYALDNIVSARPRLWGGIIAVLALFSTIVLWWFLRHA